MRFLRRFALAAVLSAPVTLGVFAAPAAAEFGPIRLVSKTVPQQGREAQAPAVSADGRYVAFEGVMDGGQKGIFRADLETGVVERVATGLAIENGVTTSAKAPSISAEGRYVCFTTEAPLDPADDPEPRSKDVYVADMSTVPPTYELVSAVNGSDEAMSTPATAAPRVAISADGTEVVFVSGGQVYLRDTTTRTTTLVSVARDPLTGAMEPGTPVPGGAVMEKSNFVSGASISADGTTVAWLGTHLPAQVPMLADEEAAVERADAAGFMPYDEPLWRRVADGPLAATRRIVGGGDPLAPGCPQDGTLAEPACQGPFPGILSRPEPPNLASGWLGVPNVDGVPQLSADGCTALVIGNPTEASNLFLVNMAEGLTRMQATRQLTAQVSVRPGEEGPRINVEPYVPLNGWIYDAAISPDGKQIAFVTTRQKFPLAPPNLDTPPPSEIGLDELYLIDLENESLRRVTHGYGALSEPSLAPGNSEHSGLSEYGASSPSLSDGGAVIGFASGASNLVPGDGNENKDVFTIEDALAAGNVASAATGGPVKASVKPRRRLTLSAFSLPSGKVKLVATAPVAGKLRAQAAAVLRIGKSPRRVAAKGTRAKAGKPARLILALPDRLRRLARSREGLYATVRATLHPRRSLALRARLQVRFHAHARKHRGAK